MASSGDLPILPKNALALRYLYGCSSLVVMSGRMSPAWSTHRISFLRRRLRRYGEYIRGRRWRHQSRDHHGWGDERTKMTVHVISCRRWSAWAAVVDRRRRATRCRRQTDVVVFDSDDAIVWRPSRTPQHTHWISNVISSSWQLLLTTSRDVLISRHPVTSHRSMSKVVNISDTVSIKRTRKN